MDLTKGHTMFRNRAVLVKLSKTPENETIGEVIDERLIEEKTDALLHSFEKFAIKAFGCLCIYVLVDTVRQVAVARASQPYPNEQI